MPLIREELRPEPDQWSWALEAVTEENPESPEEMGTTRRMAEAWPRWGEQQGLMEDREAADRKENTTL